MPQIVEVLKYVHDVVDSGEDLGILGLGLEQRTVLNTRVQA